MPSRRAFQSDVAAVLERASLTVDMFSVAAVLPTVAKSQALAWSVALCFIVSSYAFCVATPLAAITEDRGLSSGAKGRARLVYIVNMIGAASSLIGAIILAFSAGYSLL